MGVTYGGLAIFGGGPARFEMGPCGRVLEGPKTSTNFSSKHKDEGEASFEIRQYGRLVSSSAGAVWSLFDGVRAAAQSGVDGTLVDDTGRTWEGLRLVEFAATGPIERGAQWSLPYEALYMEVV